jgi:hypothetical protein
MGNYATDLAGTPPLIAHYDGKGLNLTNKLQSSGQTITSGAVFPTPVLSLIAEDSFSKVSAEVGLTKDGWQRSKGTTSLDNISPKYNSDTAANLNPSAETVGENDLNNRITITSGAVAVPVVSGLPGASFTVGNPVTATVAIASGAAAEAVSFNWQKTQDGINFEDIDSDDAIYTNAHTAQMTVTGFDQGNIIGDQYRCKVSEANSPNVFTNIVTAIPV